MSLFDPIKTALETIQYMTGKIYHAEALKNAQPPFVFWIQNAEDAQEDLNGYTELCEAGYEVHIVTRNLDTLDALAAAVRSSILALQGTTTGGFLYEHVRIRQISPVINEKEVGLYRKVYQLNINYQIVPNLGTTQTGGNAI